MTDARKPGWWRGLWSFALFSPKGLLVAAATCAAVFAILHAAGLREYASILCGQAPTGSLADRWAIYFGVAYILFYFAFVLVVPILTLGAGVMAVLQWRLTRRKGVS